MEDEPRSRGVLVPGEYRDVTQRPMDAVPSAGEGSGTEITGG